MKFKFFKNLFSNFFENKNKGFSITIPTYENEPKELKLNQKKIEDIANKNNVTSDFIIEILYEYDHLRADDKGEYWTHHKIDFILKELVISPYIEKK
jgi:hypothetical protein